MSGRILQVIPPTIGKKKRKKDKDYAKPVGRRCRNNICYKRVLISMLFAACFILPPTTLFLLLKIYYA